MLQFTGVIKCLLPKFDVLSEDIAYDFNTVNMVTVLSLCVN